jgi:DNA polymerase kappa
MKVISSKSILCSGELSLLLLYVSITPYCQKHNLSASECVDEMRRVVFEETKLTVSAGIAPNKVLFPVIYYTGL